MKEDEKGEVRCLGWVQKVGIVDEEHGTKGSESLKVRTSGGGEGQSAVGEELGEGKLEGCQVRGELELTRLGDGRDD